MIRSAIRSSVRRAPRSTQCLFARSYASDAPSSTPPMLLKLRADLKTAMRAKDADRLSVLRGVLAEITNAAKTPSPVQSDLQILSLLRKRATASHAASEEFKSAGRQDLVDKEVRQSEILEAYAGEVETLGEDEIQTAIGKVLEEMRAVAQGRVNMGDVLKKLLGVGGSLEGKPVEKSTVARLVKQAMSSTSAS